ncbi:MAG TPA: BolA/IbaG family iron-sulfur metabolism protein [Verrucomicrobiae bacterium]|nr:BolA/IbaG family iron-sulfur metabolism protein [Verrucomicrobiae bacterium]
MIEPHEIRDRILGALPGAEVTVRDMTGTADHYEITVVSSAFGELSLVDRHRMVHAPLRDVLGGALHAISLKTLAPGE